MNLFVDELRTSVSATKAAKGLLLALEKVESILHLRGRKPIFCSDFSLLMLVVLGMQKDKLRSCLQKGLKMAAARNVSIFLPQSAKKRLQDVSLDSSKALSLGYQPLSLGEELIGLRGKV